MPEAFQQLYEPLAIITAVMTVWWVIIFRTHRAYTLLDERGVQVQAVIVEIERAKLCFGIKFHLETPKMRYRFLTRDGFEVLSDKKDIPYIMRSREEQDVIPIYYLPQNPDINHMAENLKMHLKGWQLWLFVPLVGWLLLVSPLLASTLLGG